MFCVLNYQHLYEKIIYASYRKLSKEHKTGGEILKGQVFFKVMDQNSQNNVLINNSRTT